MWPDWVSKLGPLVLSQMHTDCALRPCWYRNDVILMLVGCNDITLRSVRRYFDIMCLLDIYFILGILVNGIPYMISSVHCLL